MCIRHVLHRAINCSRLHLRAAVLAFLLPLLLVAFSTPVRAENSLQQELRELAKNVKTLLDARKETAIHVGQFIPHGLPASAGPVIARTLTDELRNLGVVVKLKAKLTIQGKYTTEDDAKSNLLMVKLDAQIVDDKGKEIVGLELPPRGIFGDATIATLMGLTVKLPPDGDARARDEKLRSSVDKPQTHVQNTRIQAPGAPYALEILVKTGKDYKPRPAKDKEGFAFVEINRDEVYAVRIINEADHEVAITLTIDGLNMFTFSDIKDAKTGKPKYEQLLVGAKSTFDIKGWHKDNKQSYEFVVTEYARSAAAEKSESSADIGTITVTFAAAWPVNAKPPADEPPNPGEHARSAGDATGRGKAFTQKYNEVQRQFGVTRAAISVRYTRE
jgi:hypothetical protein